MNIDIRNVIHNSFFPVMVFGLLSVFFHMMGYEIWKWISVFMTIGTFIKFFNNVVVEKYSGISGFWDIVRFCLYFVFSASWLIYVQFIRPELNLPPISLTETFAGFFEMVFVVWVGGACTLWFLVACVFFNYIGITIEKKDILLAVIKKQKAWATARSEMINNG